MSQYQPPISAQQRNEWKNRTVADATSIGPSFELPNEPLVYPTTPPRDLYLIVNHLKDLVLDLLLMNKELNTKISALVDRLDSLGNKIEVIAPGITSSDGFASKNAGSENEEKIIDLLHLQIINLLKQKLESKFDEQIIRINIKEFNDEELVVGIDYDASVVDNETLFNVINTLNEFGRLINKAVIIEDT